jgi:hypothetical protein
VGKKPKAFKKKQTREVNRLIATQLTDTEQAIITSVHPAYTSSILVDGDYDLELLLVKISEANAKFFRVYKPTLSIRSYLKNRNDKHRKGLSTLFDTFCAEESQKKEAGKKSAFNRKKKRQHFLIEEDNDSDRGESNPYDHFDDEPDLTEEPRETYPAYKKPHEKRNCVNPCCVKKI